MRAGPSEQLGPFNLQKPTEGDRQMMKGMVLWIAGVPLFAIVLLYLFGFM